MAGKEIKPKAIECSCFRHSYPSLIYYQLYLQPSGFIPKYLSQFAFLDLNAAEMSCQWYIVDDKCLLVCHTELNGIYMLWSREYFSIPFKKQKYLFLFYQMVVFHYIFLHICFTQGVQFYMPSIRPTYIIYLHKRYARAPKRRGTFFKKIPDHLESPWNRVSHMIYYNTILGSKRMPEKPNWFIPVVHLV